MGVFTEMCNCPNQQVVSAGQNLNINNDLENNALINQDQKQNVEEKNGKKKNNNNNEANNDAETYNLSLKGGIMAPKRKKKAKDKLSNKGVEKEKKENMINNNLIDDTSDESNISDSVVSDIVLTEKLKLISKEKKSKFKDSNKINIVIIGQKEVGKSSFCIRFVENRFEDFYIPSIGVEKFAKMTAYNSRNFKINFSVICGSDKLKKWINFFFFFYDITKIRSFNYLNLYLKQLKNYLFLCDKEEKTPNFCIIGNKYDIEGEKKISNDIINKMIKNNGIKYFDISVKSLKNINNLIQFFVKTYDKLAFP